MLDTIPYIFFFALRADEKGVCICIYRLKERGELGGERVVLGLYVEGLKEIGRRKGCCTRLHFNTLSCAPEIARDILRMERGREECGELGGERAVSSQNHAYIHFSLHVRQNHVYSQLLWHVHQNHAYSHLLLHARQSHFLLPPVAITNALLSGLRAQHNYQKSTFS